VEFEFVTGCDKATDGKLVQGLFMEGADFVEGELCESALKVIHVPMPQMELLPVINKAPVDETVYQCPTYVTGDRAGTLSTTGHSTNFIMTVDLSSGTMPSSHWIKRSVALLS
jgi:dynein heavy chain